MGLAQLREELAREIARYDEAEARSLEARTDLALCHARVAAGQGNDDAAAIAKHETDAAIVAHLQAGTHLRASLDRYLRALLQGRANNRQVWRDLCAIAPGLGGYSLDPVRS